MSEEKEQLLHVKEEIIRLAVLLQNCTDAEALSLRIKLEHNLDDMKRLIESK